MRAGQLIRFMAGGGNSNKNLRVEAMSASGTTTPDLYDAPGIPNVISSDGPAELNLTSQVVELPDGSTKAAAAQCDLVMPGRPDQWDALQKGLENGAVQLEDLRRSAARVLWMVRQAMKMKPDLLTH